MARTCIQYAHSSLLSYLSYNSSAIVTSHWNKLNFVRHLIDYVKNTHHEHEIFLRQNVIKTKPYSSENNGSSNKLVQIDRLIKSTYTSYCFHICSWIIIFFNVKLILSLLFSRYLVSVTKLMSTIIRSLFMLISVWKN